jgi:hypothetical protein
MIWPSLSQLKRPWKDCVTSQDNCYAALQRRSKYCYRLMRLFGISLREGGAASARGAPTIPYQKKPSFFGL